jgi:hypothetical protein
MSTSEGQGGRASRALKNQAFFRDVNERVRDLNDAFSAVDPLGKWICECANHTCIEGVDMTLEEYEAVREHPTRFFVFGSDAHVWPDIERIVDRNHRYWVVELNGRPGEIAMKADPRSGY